MLITLFLVIIFPKIGQKATSNILDIDPLTGLSHVLSAARGHVLGPLRLTICTL